METKVITSERFSLSLRDTLKGLIMVVVTAIISVAYEAITASGDLSKLDWKTIVTSGIIAGVAYLFKNGILEPPKVITVTDTNTKAVHLTQDIKNAL